MKIACIGSREITPEIEKEMEKIGEYIANRKWWLGSGNALGSDAAYARGANRVDPSRVILYLPWASYNKALIHPQNRILIEPKEEWESIAARHHPTYPLLSPSVKQLMIRNAGIVRNADAVIAFLNRRKSGGGGTGHGWRIAETLGIPRLDVSHPKNMERALEFLQDVSVGSLP